jgi:hypothetical protein
MKRLVMASGTVLAMALAVGMQGCGSSDNTGSGTQTSNGGSGNASSAGAGNATSAAGAPGASGSPSGASGAPAGGAPAGGAPTGGAGAPATGAGAGGAAPSGGGTSGAGGAAPAGGGVSGATTGGSGGSGTAPATCVNGEASKGACTTAGSVCGKSCGPDKSLGAYKTETCTSGAFVEGVCTYPTTGTYACYKLPATLAACTADAMGPLSGSACTVADCMPCGPAYQSSTGAKSGACVCTDMKWACASSKEWPPQD